MGRHYDTKNSLQSSIQAFMTNDVDREMLSCVEISSILYDFLRKWLPQIFSHCHFSFETCYQRVQNEPYPLVESYNKLKRKEKIL